MTATRSYVMLLVLSLGLCGCGDEAKPDDGTKQSNGGSEAAPSPSTATGGSEEIGEDQPPTSAGSTDPAQPKTPEPVQVPDLPPLVFDPPLPTTPVAHVNDKPVPAGQLLEFVLMQNFSAGVQNLILGKIADRELEKSSIVVDEEAIMDEIRVVLQKSAPGRSIDQIRRDGKISMKHLRRQARTQRGWKEIFWLRQGIKEEQRHDQTNEMLLQFWIRQTAQNYDTRGRGGNPGPLAGLAAQVTDKSDGHEMFITAGEALDFLIGLAKLGGLIEGREQIIDRAIIDQALGKVGEKVSEQEIAQWAAEQRVKHPPPFTWEHICRMKGTTTEGEMERMRRILAYLRVSKAEPTEEEMMQFVDDNKSFFLGKTKKVSHILVRTTNAETDLPIEGSEEAAKSKVETIHQKLAEGLDFAWMAETYSDDPVTARGQGRLAQPVKQWGGPLDPAFRDGAWALEKIGDISPPIKSRFGWHVIKLDEVNEPTRREIDWKEPRYWDWIKDEFLTQKADNWLAKLKDESTIERADNQAIFDLKEKTYWKAPEAPKKEEKGNDD